MKVSELIKKLQEVKKRYGNLPVIYRECCYGDAEIKEMRVWTAHGEPPDMRKKTTDPAVQIQLY